MKIVPILFLLFITSTQAQILGCTDPLSKNHNPLATQNDGSCRYPRTRIKPDLSVQLGADLKETSSLLLWNSLLWTANDDSDTVLYGMDTAGVIQKEILIRPTSGNQRPIPPILTAKHSLLRMTAFTCLQNSGNTKERLYTHCPKFREFMSPS